MALRATAKGTTKYEEALELKAELMERAEKREAERIKHLNKQPRCIEQPLNKQRIPEQSEDLGNETKESMANSTDDADQYPM